MTLADQMFQLSKQKPVFYFIESDGVIFASAEREGEQADGVLDGSDESAALLCLALGIDGRYFHVDSPPRN